ncbi:MAG: aminoacyl-tRNA hydrolase [Planctomycetes bacterium]|nr:aminoacyl-tRNA hydrolase [Planctomycetota bacterium]
MRLIVGIGNPGKEYDGTRHNLGFAVIDELARRHHLSSWSTKWSARVCEWQPTEALGADKALLVKPQTYVNKSGETVQSILGFFKAPVSDLLVVVDDLNLAFGHLRLRADGSAGGHNGLRNIEALIGNHYPRLRLGMGPLPPGADQIGFVLTGFPPEQRTEAEGMIRKAADCVECWMREGVAVACRFNGPLVRPEPPPPRPKPVRPPTGGPEGVPYSGDHGEPEK